MPIEELDETDIRILRALQADGRLANVDLAERINLSPSPCLRRTKRLEAAGVIAGYRAEIDRAKIGLGLTVFVEIKVERHSRSNADELTAALLAIPEVVSCCMVSGAADFLVELAVADLAAYERLLSDRLLVLPMIADIRSNFALRVIKTAGALAIPDATATKQP
jgi:Lrp/AsnC family leucine-responsive transcriptional regulator